MCGTAEEQVSANKAEAQQHLAEHDRARDTMLADIMTIVDELQRELQDSRAETQATTEKNIKVLERASAAVKEAKQARHALKALRHEHTSQVERAARDAADAEQVKAREALQRQRHAQQASAERDRAAMQDTSRLLADQAAQLANVRAQVASLQGKEQQLTSLLTSSQRDLQCNRDSLACMQQQQQQLYAANAELSSRHVPYSIWRYDNFHPSC